MRVLFFIVALISLPCIPSDKSALLFKKEKIQYVCHVCPHVKDIYDTQVYEHDGKCPVCNMDLIELHKRSLKAKVSLHEGSGNYFIAGGTGNENKLINVFYHMPRNFDDNSKVLIVLPGAGRNAWSYRDTWVDASEEFNVLILSPSYASKEYDFAGYNLAGLVSNFAFNNEEAMKQGEKSGKYHFKDDELVFNVNMDSETWIFHDFDRIFDSAIGFLKTKHSHYDIFGHSAGGQILHRLPIFHPESKANRIISSNSGSYTVIDENDGLPFGLKGSQITNKSLRKSFKAKLTLLIGEKDNKDEKRGSLLHTPTVDKQGLGRLSRSIYFFDTSRSKAQQLNAEFNWEHKVVKGVGHDYQNMSQAAAKLLYSE